MCRRFRTGYPARNAWRRSPALHLALAPGGLAACQSFLRGRREAVERAAGSEGHAGGASGGSEERTFRSLVLARSMRSVGINFSTIALPLYMAALGYSTVIIGASFVLMTLAGTAMVFAWGVVGDRVGYRKVLLLVEALFAGSSLVLASNTSLVPIIIAAVMGGYGGQGGGGLRGSFGPGLSAFVGSTWKDANERTRRIGAIASVGGMAGLAGYPLLALADALVSAYGTARAFQTAYLVAFATSVASILALLMTKEGGRPPRTARILTRRSQKFVGKVVVTNVFNGVGLGLAVPLLPLWFSLRFGYSAGTIALIFGASTFASSVASYFSHVVAARIGNVGAGSVTRVVNGASLIAMALSPWGALAAAVYAVRGVSGGLGAPARTSVTLGGVEESELGAATSISGVSMRASLVSTGLAGYLLAVAANTPLGVGGAFQIVSGVLYRRLLGPGEDRGGARRPGGGAGPTGVEPGGFGTRISRPFRVPM